MLFAGQLGVEQATHFAWVLPLLVEAGVHRHLTLSELDLG